MYETIKARIYDIITPNETRPYAEQLFTLFITLLIALNVVAVILGTVTSVTVKYGQYLNLFNTVSLIIFSAEYILRVWSCTADPNYASPIAGRIKFIFSPLALLDLIAILPFFAPFVTTADLRIFRILRLLTLLKLTRYSAEFSLFGKVLSSKKTEIIISAVAVVLLLILSSTLMFFAEHKTQPHAFGNIPDAMWWAVVTLSTVGYGDLLPHTPLGKVIASCVSVLGIAIFAIPAGIIASGFVEEMKKTTEMTATVCPHCGKDINQHPSQPAPPPSEPPSSPTG
ncbi:MAG: ion transporter [Candidatus Dadabacteria bacterium]|jgi:voltage-gated potassium channel|nr:ion transporter [Candidatus Dadabacteria bacterium]